MTKKRTKTIKKSMSTINKSDLEKKVKEVGEHAIIVYKGETYNWDTLMKKSKEESKYIYDLDQLSLQNSQTKEHITLLPSAQN